MHVRAMTLKPETLKPVTLGDSQVETLVTTKLVAQLNDLFHCYLDFCSDLPDLREIQCSNVLPGVHPRHVVQAGLSVTETHNSYLKKNTKKIVFDWA